MEFSWITIRLNTIYCIIFLDQVILRWKYCGNTAQSKFNLTRVQIQDILISKTLLNHWVIRDLYIKRIGKGINQNNAFSESYWCNFIDHKLLILIRDSCRVIFYGMCTVTKCIIAIAKWYILLLECIPSKHCSTGTIPAQYRGYSRNGTGPPLFYYHLRNSDLPFCTSAFYRSGTGKLLPYRYQPAQLHYIASIIYVVAWCWASTSPVQNLLWACHWPRTIQSVSG